MKPTGGKLDNPKGRKKGNAGAHDKDAKGLTPKQSLFVAEYLVDLNATQAAIRAGYSPKTANEQAARLLAKASAQQAVQAGMAKREKRTAITADRVLEQYARLAFFDIRNLYDTDGNLKDLRDLDDETATAVAGVEFVEMPGSRAVVRKVRLVDRRAALADVGKHLGMFIERVEVSGKLDLAQVIAEGRKRVSGK